MTFKYDNLGRMQVADVTDGMGANLNNYDIGVGTGNETKFDANGNLSFLREGTTNRNYKYFTGTNLIKNTDGSSNIYYTHDKNGNVTYSPYPKEWQYSYDPYFNLTTGVNFEEYSETIMYGADNERVFKQYITDPVTNYTYKTYYYRGLSEYPLVEKNYQNSTLINTTLYIYGPTGLIAVKDGSTFNYILKDHLGSTRAVLNSSNIRVAKYHYSPYGRIMYSYVNTNVAYKFTGQEFDDETGLHNFRARLYDAELGMFYAYDPAAQGFSPFGYCGNNPVINVDHSGKTFLPLIIMGFNALFDAIKGATQDGFWGAFDGFCQGAVSSAPSAILPEVLAYTGSAGSLFSDVATHSLIGGSVGGIGYTANNKNFFEGFGIGVLAGATTWGGEQINFMSIGGWEGLISKGITSASISAIENLGFGESWSSSFTYNFGPLQMSFGPHKKPQYGLSSFESLYGLAKGLTSEKYSFDPLETLKSGSPLFSAESKAVRGVGKFTYGETWGDVILIDNPYLSQQTAWSAYSGSVTGIAHERGHIIQSRMARLYGSNYFNFGHFYKPGVDLTWLMYNIYGAFYEYEENIYEIPLLFRR